MEHRAAKRVPRRLKVMFGAAELTQSGFTQDISETGLFITASRFPALGSRLRVQFELPQQDAVTVSAEVVRHAIVPPELRSVQRHGFGMRISGDRGSMRSVLEATWSGARPPAVPPQPVVPAAHPVTRWQTREEWNRVRDEQLRHGGLTFRSQRELKFDETVQVPVAWPYAGTIGAVAVRVVHCHREGDAFMTMGLLVDPASLDQLDALAGTTNR